MKYSRLGILIKNRREQLGIKIETIALECGIRAVSYISRIENGHVPVSAKVLKRIVAALDLDPAQVKDALTDIALREVDELVCELTKMA